MRTHQRSGYSQVESSESTSNSLVAKQTVDELFFRVVVDRTNNPALLANKSDILKQAFANLGWDINKTLSTEDFNLLENELEQVVYADGYLPSLFPGGDHLEYIDHEQSPHQQYSAYGRNMLRLFWREMNSFPGSQAFSLCPPNKFTKPDGQTLNFCPRKDFSNEIHHQFVKEAYKAALKEALNSYAIADEWAAYKDLKSDDLKQYEIFQSCLLVSYANQKPNLPGPLGILQAQLVTDEKMGTTDLNCHSVFYHTECLDLSPQSGPLSWVLEEEDRFYAYGLVAEEKAENSRLVLLGTPLPPEQGAGLANLYNFYPFASIGEAHYLGGVINWIEKQARNGKKVEIIGHSKGATLAMILTVLCASAVVKTTSLNPVPLSSPTYYRLKARLDRLAQLPLLQATIHNNDLFYLLEKHFLPGTQIYRVIPTAQKNAGNTHEPQTFYLKQLLKSLHRYIEDFIKAHNDAYEGRQSAIFLRVNFAIEKTAKLRHFLHDTKYIINLLFFPVLYGQLFFEIVARKMQRFYTQHKKLIRALMIVAALATCAALLATGVLAAVVALAAGPVLELVGVSLTAGLTLGITIGLSVVTSLLTPWILKAALKLTSTVLGLAGGITLLSFGIVAATLSGLKLGLTSLGNLCRTNETVKNSNQLRRLQENSISNASSTISMTSRSSTASMLTETKSHVFDQAPVTKYKMRYFAWKQVENQKMRTLYQALQPIITAEKKRLTESRGRVVENDEELKQEIEGEIGVRRRELESIELALSQKLVEARDKPDVSFADYQKATSTYLKSVLTENSSALDKYSSDYCAKFAIGLSNAILGLTIAPGLFKAYFTESFFFSWAGKTKEAVEQAYEISRAQSFIHS